MDDEQRRNADEVAPNGHITSLAVLRPYRKLGLASKLMEQANAAMRETYGSQHCSLHVRRSNRAALHLYRQTMGFEETKLERGYYADREDAFAMRKPLGAPVGKWVQVEEKRLLRVKQAQDAKQLEESESDRKARLRREKAEKDKGGGGASAAADAVAAKPKEEGKAKSSKEEGKAPAAAAPAGPKEAAASGDAAPAKAAAAKNKKKKKK